MLVKTLKIVSLVFEPFLVGFFTFVVVLSTTSLSTELKIAWLVIAAAVAGFPPLAILVYEKKTGKITDWFIYKREERRDVEIAWVFGSLIFSLVVYFLQGPKILFALSLDLFLIGILFTLINFFWKISIHAAMISLFVLTLIIFKSVLYLPSVLLIPLVGYSRWYLHKHTLTQLTVGSILTLIISYAVFYLLGLVSF